MNCIIVDDERPSIVLLQGLCNRYGISVSASFTNPAQALPYIQNTHPDFVLLDIQMDAMNGLDLADQLNHHTKIIFCTAYEKFAVKSYEFNAVDYLLKPISYARFCIAINRLENLLDEKQRKPMPAIEEDYIFFRLINTSSIAKVEVNSINYITSAKNYINLHTNTGIKTVYSTLYEMENRLPVSKFMRIHKSYIIPIRRVVQFNVNSISINCANNEIMQLPIGDKFRKNITAYLNSINLVQRSGG
jgi:two-component system, LytTR family, response regulator